MFSGCTGQLLFTFIILPLLIVLLWRTGILAEFRPVVSMVIDAVQEILKLFIEFLKDPNSINATSIDIYAR